MSECSPYIRQAVERCKLPIVVRCYPDDDGWTIVRPGTNCHYSHPLDARRNYLAAVKELTK